MLKYRDFMTITKKEVEFIINDIIKPIKILSIKKDKAFDCVYVKIKSEWKDSESCTIITDDLILSNSGIDCPFSLSVDDRINYEKYLLSLGMNDLLFENKYLPSFKRDEDKLRLC